MGIPDLLECTIDFEGQHLADRLTHGIVGTSAVVGFVAGYATQSLQTTMLVFAGALGLAALLVLPPWPMYNRHPQKWLPKQQQ
ncbi:hypothetical protein VTP01DRAFT_42 [Rhizomucor pusillus]|uniref:uncharacterized protein n=1 Tax=Rhizomucor pusillus TaxID=4840 RepID=UPI0037420DDB